MLRISWRVELAISCTVAIEAQQHRGERPVGELGSTLRTGSSVVIEAHGSPAYRQLPHRGDRDQQQGGEGDHRHAVAAMRRAWPAALAAAL